jgi:hypothetical protein
MQKGRHTTYTYDGTDYDEAEDFTAPGPFERELSHRCYACGLLYRESKMTLYKGKWYGIPCTCYKDIRSLVEKELDRRRGRS